MGGISVKTGYSIDKNECVAVAEVLRQITQQNIKCVLFFVSSHYEQQKISDAINSYAQEDDAYKDVEFVGCTSAGEFTQEGFTNKSFSAMSFASPDLAVGVGIGKQISDNPIGAAKKAVEKACSQLAINVDELDSDNYTGLVLIDGLQSAEEYIMLGLSKIARPLRVAGGSAGDDFNFKKTFIHARGKTYDNVMVLLVFKTATPMRIVQTSSYLPTTKRLKVTKADLDNRIVYEFNGRPAADEYARALGLDLESLNSDVFMQHPLAMSFEDEYYMRSIFKVLNEERALMFFSRLTEGTNVTIMRPGQVLEETQEVIRKLQKDLTDISAIIAFNCFLRYRESEREGNLSELIDEISIAPLLGFNTYGEQYNGMHINQTMTLIVFGG